MDLLKKIAKIGLAAIVLQLSPNNQAKAEDLSDFEPKIQKFLDEPYTLFKKDKVPGGFRIILLSNIAEGCTNIVVDDSDYEEVAKDCVKKVVDIALDERISPYSVPVEKVQNFGNNGLYTSHLNIILGAYKRVTDDDRYKQLNERISKHLASKTLRDPHKHVISFPSITNIKWPADQAATLYSLYLFDKNFEQNISDEPTQVWLQYMKEHGTDKKTGLHYSEVTRNVDFWKYPRGGALSWSIRYMSSFAPEEAEDLWQRYIIHYKVDAVVIAGFREWPHGIERKADIDSGPIVFGIGASATAFAIGASKAVGDYVTYAQLMSMVKFGESVAAVDSIEEVQERINSDGLLAKTGDSILGKAILFNGTTQTQWYDK